MRVLGWVLIGLAVWLVLAVVVAVALCRVIARADRQDGPGRTGMLR